jgi:YbbR domain-containing protein
MSKINVPFALLSLATSVLLWASVYNDRNDKPTQKVIPASLTARGLSDKLVITKIPDSVSLQLSGYTRDFRTVSQLTPTAIVDLERATIGEKDYPIVVFPSSIRELLGGSVTVAKIKIDKLVTKKVDVVPKIIGTLRPGWQQEPIDTFPRWVYITGPSELVEKVVSVQVIVNFLSINESPTEMELDPRPIDAGERTIPNILMSDTDATPTYRFNDVINELKIRTTVKFLAEVLTPPKK